MATQKGTERTIRRNSIEARIDAKGIEQALQREIRASTTKQFFSNRA